jgi:hypothetical protein
VFLEQLKNDQQKESFMNLAYQVATADGSFGLPEIEMMNMFERETGVKDWKNNKEPLPIAQIGTMFSDELSRKIIYSNLLAIGVSEEYENVSQKRLIEQIRESLEISGRDEQEYQKWMKIIKGSYFPRYYID